MTFAPHRRRLFDVRPTEEPMNWAKALLLMTIAAAVLWAVQFVNWLMDQRLDRFGLRPRELDGLWGVVTAPFLHTGWWNVLSNSPAFIVLGWAVLLSGVRVWATATAFVVVLGGLLTWAVAPHGLIVGVNGLVFGWLGYLLARAFFARRILWIFGAVTVTFVFSGLFAGLVPSHHAHVSWPGNVSSFAAGAFVGWLLHPRVQRGKPGKAVPA